MIVTSQLLLRTPIVRVDLERLAFYLKILGIARRFILVGFVMFWASIFVQLIYPPGVARPLTRLDSASVGFKPASQIKDYLKMSDNTQRVIKIGHTSYRFVMSDLGIRSNLSESAGSATDYTLRERLTPFSILKTKHTQSVRYVNEIKLRQAVRKFTSQNAQAPSNPRAELVASKFTVTPGSNGVTFDEAKLKQLLVNVSPRATKLEYGGQVLKPVVNEEKLAGVVTAANEQLTQPFMLYVEGKPYVASPDKLSNWIKINTDENTGTITTTYDTASIKLWLANNIPLILKAPVAAKNVVVDEVVVQSTPGQAGLAVNQDNTANAISQALTAKTNETKAVTKPVSAPVQVVRSFSATSHGLELLIANWSKARPRMTAGVVLKEIGGQGRQATLNAGKQFYPASIYKLFTTLFLAVEIAQGHIDPNSEVLQGKSISTCMEIMIVVSDNNCPSTIGKTYGWSAIDSAAKSKGFAATSLASVLATTPNDVANFLYALAGGSLMSATDSTTLLDRMQRQVYRSAIPAGSAGCAVADKVGFINNYWHDAAIVACPHAKYILVVFTQNGGSQAIRDLASQISNLLK